MGWAQKLCETYDRVSAAASENAEWEPMVPVGFVKKQANYRVTLDRNGRFFQVAPYGKNIAVPTLSAADARTGLMPYPFLDDLRYLAGDLDECLGTTQFDRYYQSFVKQLAAWCQREDAPEALRLMLSYLREKRLMRDLREYGFTLTEKDVKTTVVIDVIADDVRSLWDRQELKASWMAYLRASDTAEKRLCYVEGMVLPSLSIHPKVYKGAKLMSAKDDVNPIRYKGRFETDQQALSMSFEASAKIHSTLHWLLERQGFSRFGIFVVLWSPGGVKTENPLDDDVSWLTGGEEAPDTMQAYGQSLAKAIAGYQQKLIYDSRVDFSQVVLMGLQAATPGRMSITHYQEMSISQYVGSLENWYLHCVWRLERTDGETRRYLSTPTPREIAIAIYGEGNVDKALHDDNEEEKNKKAITKQVRTLYMRLLPCIVERRPLPADIVQSAFRKVCNPLRYTTGSGKWDKKQWEWALAVTCALVAKRAYDTTKEVHSVTLDKTRTERNYLFGRLLAVANQIEMHAMEDCSRQTSRQTNAVRYMQALQLRPVATWRRINNLLIPYLGKLKSVADFYTKTLNEIGEKIDFSDNTPLDGRFLEGYYAQGYAYQTEAAEGKKQKSEGEKNNDTVEQ